jgi:surface protein
MNNMFENANAFNINISGWNISNVTNMDSMFRNASAFNQNLSSWHVPLIPSLPSNFSTGSLITNFPQWGVTGPTGPPINNNAVNFVVAAFDSQVQLTSSLQLPTASINELNVDAHILLDATVLATDLQNTFFFQTDLPITGSDSFLYHYVDTTKWQNISTVVNPQNGKVLDGFVSLDPIGKDFLRYLAQKLFGTYLGADLFINEDAVIAEIKTKCDEVAAHIVSLLNGVDLNQGVNVGLLRDSYQKLYMNDDQSSSENICRELFNQISTQFPARFADIKLYKYNETEDGFYKLPILAGDTISFKVTISPSVNQLTAVQTTSLTSIPDRIYEVKLRIV